MDVPALDRVFPRVGEVTERRLGAAFGVQPTAFRGAPAAQVRAEEASVERLESYGGRSSLEGSFAQQSCGCVQGSRVKLHVCGKGLRAGDAVDVGAAARESPGEQILQLISRIAEWRQKKGRAFQSTPVRTCVHVVPAICPGTALHRFPLDVVGPTASFYHR